jgi:hypothetical protein
MKEETTKSVANKQNKEIDQICGIQAIGKT